eukprot:Skav211258  [mRNA]  locus=scaffold3676:158327:161479:+ [translate_table: standard]
MARSCDVLARRQQPLEVEGPKITQFLTEHGKFRVAELKKGKDIPPELVDRMRRLEFRIFDRCRKLTEVSSQILAACQSVGSVSEDELSELLIEMKEYVTNLCDIDQERQDNLKVIVAAERDELEKFRKMYDDVDRERRTSGVLSFCGTAAGLTVGIAAMCPVTLVGVALFAAFSAAATAGHRQAAWEVQESLAKDMAAKNVPIQTACENIVGLASDPTLSSAFGITEMRRLQAAHSELQSAIAAVGLKSIQRHLEEIPNPMLKVDLQNVIYRYLAESARCFKKIQHSIRSGEAELLVFCDGEEPQADDLEAVFEDFVAAVEALRDWTKTGRTRAGKLLVDRFHKESRDLAEENGASATTAGAAASVLLISYLWGGPMGFGAAASALAGAVGVDYGLCLAPRKTPQDGVMAAWDRSEGTEEHIVTFLRSLAIGFQNLPFEQAQKRAQDLRSELDRFLQLLQTEGFIFEPCSSSSFQF